MNQNNPPKEPEDSQQDETRAQRSFATEEPNINSGDSYLGSRRPEADHDLDANAPQLSTHDAKRFSRIALTSAIVLGLLMACVVGLLIVRKSGSSTVDNAKSKEEKVVVPDTPESQAGDPAAMAPIPLYQAPAVGHKDAAPITDSASDEAAQRPREPTLMERRIGSAESGGSQAPAADPYVQAMLGGLGDKSGDMAKEQSSTQTTRAQFIANPDALLVRGTYLRCVLETRIVTDIKGFTSCIVTEPVYSLNGRKLLIPKGSKISGTYGTDANGPRVSVIWDRVITPNGVDVTMSSPGVDNLGGAGHPGDYNAHWGSRISSALMISLISDAFKYAGAKNGPPSTTVTNGIVTQEPFESNTARTMEQLANQALDRSISRPATVTINQGVVVNIYVAQDIDFSGVSAGI